MIFIKVYIIVDIKRAHVDIVLRLKLFLKKVFASNAIPLCSNVKNVIKWYKEICENLLL